MLERVPTCVESAGGRLLRAPKRATKSKRSIHYAFFQPNALDTLLGRFSAPNESPGAFEHTGAARDGQTEPGSFMLDFLYPVKTMAFMRRMSLYGWDQWDPRGPAKTAANGLRAFSSSTRQCTYEHTVLEHDEARLAGDYKSGADETLPLSATNDPFKAISVLLFNDGKKEYGLAWTLYRTVEPRGITGRLRSKVLSYLATSPDRVDHVHAMAIFESIPIIDRVSRDFSAAIAIRLQQGVIGAALSLHDQAMKIVKTDGFGTDRLIEYYAHGRQWDQMWRVITSYRQFVAENSSIDAKDVFARLRASKPSAANVKSIFDYYDQFRLQHEAAGALEEVTGVVMKVITAALHAAHFKERRDILQIIKRLRAMGLLKWHHYKDTIKNLLHAVESDRVMANTHSPKLLFELYSCWVQDAKSERVHHPSRDLISRVFAAYDICTRNAAATQDFAFPLNRSSDLTLIIDKTNISASSLVEDMHYFHKSLDAGFVLRAMHIYGALGDTKRTLELFDNYAATQPAEMDERLFPPLLYPFALARNPEAAQQQFNRIKMEFSTNPDTKSWAILVLAYIRSGDSEAAVRCLRRMTNAGRRPNAHIYHPIIQSFASLGDVEAVFDMFEELATFEIDHTSVHFQSALITAYLRDNNVKAANDIISSNIASRGRNERSQMAPLVTPLLAHFAIKGQLEEVLDASRRMERDGIELDFYAYGSIVMALTVVRQTSAAYKIVRRVMPKHGIKPQGWHFGMIMNGFIRQGEPMRCYEIKRYMELKGVRSTYHTTIGMLRAKYELEKDRFNRKTRSRILGKKTGRPASDPLLDPQLKLQQFMDDVRQSLTEESQIASAVKQPRAYATSHRQGSPLEDARLESVLMLYGLRNSYDMVQKVLEEEIDSQRVLEHKELGISLKVLAALMRIYLSSYDHDAVERCWTLLKREADKISTFFDIPLGKKWFLSQDRLTTVLAHLHGQYDHVLKPLGGMDNDVATDSEAPEVRTGSNGAMHAAPTAAENSNDSDSKLAVETPEDQGTITTPRILPGRAQIIKPFVNTYLRSLILKGSYDAVCNEVELLLGQGYQLDERTWNVYVESLINTQRVLEAFQIVEGLFMPEFRGWRTRSIAAAWVPREYRYTYETKSVRHKLQRVRPRTRTFILLASVMVRLRHDVESDDAANEVMEQIRKLTPRTLAAVEQMPLVESDKLQTKLLGMM